MSIVGATKIGNSESESELPENSDSSGLDPNPESLSEADVNLSDVNLSDVDVTEFDDELHSAAVDRSNPERSLLLAKSAALTAAKEGGTNVVVLDMTERTALFDYFVIATGTTRRQLHAISEEIDHVLEDELNDKRLNIDGYDESRWIVLDYGTVVVHLFDEDTRLFYSLEALWSDAPKLDLDAELKAIDPDSVS